MTEGWLEYNHKVLYCVNPYRASWNNSQWNYAKHQRPPFSIMKDRLNRCTEKDELIITLETFPDTFVNSPSTINLFKVSHSHIPFCDWFHKELISLNNENFVNIHVVWTWQMISRLCHNCEYATTAMTCARMCYIWIIQIRIRGKEFLQDFNYEFMNPLWNRFWAWDHHSCGHFAKLNIQRTLIVSKS